MVSVKRWVKAQCYERSYWQQVARRIENGTRGQLDWYRWKASELERRLKKFTGAAIERDWDILEVGTGPVGIISFVPWGMRYGMDPLEDFYRSSETLTKIRNPLVNYQKGSGEQLPFPGLKFSLVVCDNVIDHASHPQKILEEIYRVLKKDGLFYISLNIHTVWGCQAHAVLALLQIDQGHPHSFTANRIRRVLENTGFHIEGEEMEDYAEVRWRNRTSGNFKERVKGYTGLTEYQYHAICRKPR